MNAEIIKIILGFLVSLGIIFYLFFGIKIPGEKKVITWNLIFSMFILVVCFAVVVLFLGKIFVYENNALILSCIVSSLSLFFWFFIIERFDVFKEDMSRTLLFFSVAIIFMLGINLLYIKFGSGLQSIFIKALIEEIIKFILLEFFLFYENDRKTYDGFIDAMILALIVSSAFFFIENILYFTIAFQTQGLAVVTNVQLIGRILVSDFAHIIFTGMIAVGVVLAFFNSNLNKTKLEHSFFKPFCTHNNEKNGTFEMKSLENDDELIKQDLDFEYKNFSFLSIKNFFTNNLFIKILFYSDLSVITLKLSQMSRGGIILQMFIMAVLSHTFFNILVGINFIFAIFFMSILVAFYFKAIILFQNILRLHKNNIL